MKDVVQIALVGKYTKFEDSYMSVTKALKHAALSQNKLLSIVWIEAANLEEEMLETDAPAYYESWKKLSSCRYVAEFARLGMGVVLILSGLVSLVTD